VPYNVTLYNNRPSYTTKCIRQNLYYPHSVSRCVAFAFPARIRRAFSWISLFFVVFFRYHWIRHRGTKEVSIYEHSGWRTASRNELNSWTEVPLYTHTYRLVFVWCW
jgi:hypothetical protein